MSGQIVSSFQPVNRPTHQPTLVEERMPEPNDASEVINPIDHTIYDYSSTPSKLFDDLSWSDISHRQVYHLKMPTWIMLRNPHAIFIATKAVLRGLVS